MADAWNSTTVPTRTSRRSATDLEDFWGTEWELRATIAAPAVSREELQALMEELGDLVWCSKEPIQQRRPNSTRALA